MEQYTTTTTTSGEQIFVQTSGGQIQQQVICDIYMQIMRYHVMYVWHA